MFHRFSTWWRALSVVLLSLATVTWPSAAQAATTPSFSLAHQDAVAILSHAGTARFNVTFDLTGPARGSHAQLSIYARLVTRSQITPLVSGAGVAGAPVASTTNLPLNCDPRHPIALSVSLYTKVPGRVANRCTSLAPRLHLACVGQNCDGVYPLRYRITSGGVTTTEWSMIALQASRVASPLRVVLIATLDPSSGQRSRRAVAVLNTLARYAQVPLTLTADYRTLLQTLTTTADQSASWRNAFSRALASPLHRVVSAPPDNVDFAGLAAHGLANQVTTQLSLSGRLLRILDGRYVDGQVVLSGSPSLRAARALARAGVNEVVVPETALTVLPSSTLNWGAPFQIGGVAVLTALATDNPLHQLVTDSSIEPGRRAALTLASLAFLHFEEPNAPANRTVVISAPVAHTPAPFVADLLSGFADNPFFIAASLAPSFGSSLIATNGAPESRTLAKTAGSAWSTKNISTLRSLASSVNSFSHAVSSDVVASTLQVALAGSEVTGDPASRQVLINDGTSALAQQLSLFSVDPSVITLAGPGTSLPITVLSRAHYTVTAVVHLIADQLTFPKGRNLVVTLDSPTKSLRVRTANRQVSSLTLRVVLTTPDNQIVLARAAIQVRIAGNSVVGYLLTLASILVLGLWWLRTYNRRSKGRHAR